MKAKEPKKFTAEENEEPKFNIKKRYMELNEPQKKLVVEAFQNSFKKLKRAFYLVLERNSLTDEELFFFAGMFECGITDLYMEKPKETPSVFDLYRKVKGGKTGIQKRLDV